MLLLGEAGSVQDAARSAPSAVVTTWSQSKRLSGGAKLDRIPPLTVSRIRRARFVEIVSNWLPDGSRKQKASLASGPSVRVTWAVARSQKRTWLSRPSTARVL